MAAAARVDPLELVLPPGAVGQEARPRAARARAGAHEVAAAPDSCRAVASQGRPTKLGRILAYTTSANESELPEAACAACASRFFEIIDRLFRKAARRNEEGSVRLGSDTRCANRESGDLCSEAKSRAVARDDVHCTQADSSGQ